MFIRHPINTDSAAIARAERISRHWADTRILESVALHNGSGFDDPALHYQAALYLEQIHVDCLVVLSALYIQTERVVDARNCLSKSLSISRGR